MKVDEKDLLMLEMIYDGLPSKSELAKALMVGEKTVENRAKKLGDLIKYSKKFSAYKFKKLLPEFLPSRVVFKHIFNEIENLSLELEFKNLFLEQFAPKNELVATAQLSSTLKKIIALQHAANTGVIVLCSYKGEKKYIQVNQLLNSGAMRYAYVHYDVQNGEAVGQRRTLALNFISQIEAARETGRTFLERQSGNAWGIMAQKRSVRLRLLGDAAVFFKRENPKSYNFNFVAEDDEGVLIDFFYTPNSVELSRFVASWLGLVQVVGDDALADEIKSQILEKFAK